MLARLEPLPEGFPDVDKTLVPLDNVQVWTWRAGMLIAAHAPASDLTVITGNVHEFSRVLDLRVENWLDETTVGA